MSILKPVVAVHRVKKASCALPSQLKPKHRVVSSALRRDRQVTQRGYDENPRPPLQLNYNSFSKARHSGVLAACWMGCRDKARRGAEA